MDIFRTLRSGSLSVTDMLGFSGKANTPIHGLGEDYTARVVWLPPLSTPGGISPPVLVKKIHTKVPTLLIFAEDLDFYALFPLLRYPLIIFRFSHGQPYIGARLISNVAIQFWFHYAFFAVKIAGMTAALPPFFLISTQLFLIFLIPNRPC